MLIFDTNVVSELMKPKPEPRVSRWVSLQDKEKCYITTVTEAELRFGVENLPKGERQEKLKTIMSNWLEYFLPKRILVFDSDATKFYAKIRASCLSNGQGIGEVDCQIAAISQFREATLITRNTRDFTGTGTNLFNPWIED